ncbi:MFS transporter [Romboutsia sp. CE17]|uniref:MFS transporter n=1 Tax=Romboutsia sp. CE17 TaxID=2724150 RepID=UPI001442CB5B|nr:glycoside-pentoside-hexuronide (GPH):cation symporter [Romboutsia sp. CE17]QJA07771.1 MFS transporter [Romboutsia sp. CE17]
MNLNAARNLEVKNERPFGLRDKVGYLLGDLGNDFTFIFASMFLMIFYTKVWGVSTSLVGVLFLVSRCVDAFSDITMGVIADKANPTKDGKFRPWIKRIAGPVALMSFLMYQYSLADASLTIKVIVMFTTYILWGSVFYTAINIPYGSMASAITNDPKERASLSTWRSLGASFASVIIGSLTPQIIYYADANGNQLVNPEKFTMIAGVFSICAFICYMLCFKLTTERVKFESDDNKEKVSIAKNLGIIAKNKALLAIIGAAIVLLLSSLMTQTINAYLFADYFKNVNALSTLSMIGLPVNLFLAAVLVKVADRFGKKEVSMISMLITGAIYIGCYIAKITNPWIYVGIYTISSLFMNTFNMLIWAKITDIIDYNEILTGKRDDGTIYGVYSFSRKIGQALAGGLGGFALGFIGYNSMAATQSTATTDGIYALATLFPGACYIVVGLILMFAYPLSKKVVNENNLKLEAMRSSK